MQPSPWVVIMPRPTSFTSIFRAEANQFAGEGSESIVREGGDPSVNRHAEVISIVGTEGLADVKFIVIEDNEMGEPNEVYKIYPSQI